MPGVNIGRRSQSEKGRQGTLWLFIFALLQPLPGQPAGPAENHYLYVAIAEGIEVRDIDQNHTLVKTIPLPGYSYWRGICANAITGKLFLSYFNGGQCRHGLLRLDLISEQVDWDRCYDAEDEGVDRMA